MARIAIRDYAIGIDRAQDPYTRLAEAIVMRACEDYRNPKLSWDTGERKYFRSEHKRYVRASIERFFRSQWFTLLTDLDPEELIRRLRKELSYYETIYQHPRLAAARDHRYHGHPVRLDVR
jgi:hypothetical protein